MSGHDTLLAALIMLMNAVLLMAAVGAIAWVLFDWRKERSSRRSGGVAGDIRLVSRTVVRR